MQSWLKSMLFGYALLVCVWCWKLGIFLVGMIYHWNDIFAVRFRVLTCQCSSISSINQISASNSECKGYNCLSWFLKPRSCSSSDTSTIPNHIHCNVSLKFTIHLQICCKHKACVFFVWICGWASSEFCEFASIHAWHSLSVCITSSNRSLVHPLNNLSLRTFQRYQIIHG